MLKFCERIPMAPVSKTTKAGTTSTEGRTIYSLRILCPGRVMLPLTTVETEWICIQFASFKEIAV